MMTAWVLSAFEPGRSDILGRRSLPLKQLPEYRVRWLSGACSESALQRRGRVGTFEIESGEDFEVRRERGNIDLLMGRF